MAEEQAPTDRHPTRARALIAFDAAIVIVLGVVAWLIRHTGLPHNGLWHDDAWVATGAIHGHPWQIFMVGSGHPGFTGLLMLVSRATGANSSAMAYPAFVAGVLAAPLLYLALVRFGYARSISALCAAALVVADVHILYSTRVKTYALDVLIILGVAVVLPRIARLTWTWKTALAWVTFSLVVGFFSGFALVATAVAGLLLVVYAQDDRRFRIAALVTQGVAQLVLYAMIQRSSDLATIESQQEVLYDGHLTFSWNPIGLGGEVLRHFRRVVNVYPGGSKPLLTILVVTVVVGLVIAATRRRRSAEALRARFLALLLIVAIVGGFLDRFPFGPLSRGVAYHSRGERSTLWLVPVVAVGLAATLQLIRRAAGWNRWLRIAFDLGVFVTAGLVLHASIHERALPYALSGSKAATRYIEQHAGPEDAIVLPGTSTMTYAVETRSPVHLEATPQWTIGFEPIYRDPRIHAFGLASPTPATPQNIHRAVDDSLRVFVFDALPGYGSDGAVISKTLKDAGFVPSAPRNIGATQTVVWRSPRCISLPSC